MTPMNELLLINVKITYQCCMSTHDQKPLMDSWKQTSICLCRSYFLQISRYRSFLILLNEEFESFEAAYSSSTIKSK